MGEKFLPCFGQSWAWSQCLTQTLLLCTSFMGRITATVANAFHTGHAHPHPHVLIPNPTCSVSLSITVSFPQQEWSEPF